MILRSSFNSIYFNVLMAWLFVWSEVQTSYGPADATATHCLLL